MIFKNLSPSVLGISGRQSELIELALTYNFRGLEIDINDLVKRAQKQGAEHAARFFTSGQLKLGSFELPTKWRGAEEVYQSELEQLDEIARAAAAAGGTVCHTTVNPASDSLPYHDNFELHRKRLGEIAEALGQHGIRLGLAMLALPAHRADREFQFIFEADGLLALLNSITAENVGIYLDTWNWHFGGGTAEQLQSLKGHQVVGITVADAPAGADTETVSEAQRLLPGGEGVIDVAGLLGQLHAQGVDGPLTLAAAPDCFNGLTREAVVQKSKNVLDDLLKASGIVKAPDPTPELASP